MAESHNFDALNNIAQQSVSGRLPLTGAERIYTGYFSFLWTCTAFAAATWAFLIGGILPFTGDTKLGILGYFIGTIIGLLPVMLSGGLPSFRYGVDPIDATKSAFGVRGSVLPMFVLLVVNLSWSYLLVALTSRGAANVYQEISGGPVSEWLVIGIAIVTLLLGWAMTIYGPWLFERISRYVAPGHLLVTLVMLALLCSHYGFFDLLNTNVPADKAYTQDKLTGFIYAIEFGVSASLSWWPMVGGLTRLAKQRKNLTGPAVWGLAVLGAAFISAIAALAAVSAGTADPTVWMIKLGGPYLGCAIMIFVLLANIPSMVIMLYLAGVSVQQIRFFSRLRWSALIGLFMLPGLYVAFHTQWMLDEVMAFVSYIGLLSMGIASVMFVDYLILRREQLDVRHMFNASPKGKYWFIGGVNWIAVLTTFASIAFYLWLYDPISLRTQHAFVYLGAGIPTMFITGLLYYVLMKALVVSRMGAYPTSQIKTKQDEGPVEVAL